MIIIKISTSLHYYSRQPFSNFAQFFYFLLNSSFFIKNKGAYLSSLSRSPTWSMLSTPSSWREWSVVPWRKVKGSSYSRCLVIRQFIYLFYAIVIFTIYTIFTLLTSSAHFIIIPSHQILSPAMNSVTMWLCQDKRICDHHHHGKRILILPAPILFF